jgi:23S rRNA (uracil1939-C5)-methyltransferase
MTGGRETTEPAAVRIETLVPGGRGMGRLEDGRPVFVSGAFPGDTVLLQEVVEKSSFAEARARELVVASPERVTPGCPVHALCGGCDWMALGASAQENHKLSLLSQALTRVGKIPLEGVPFVFHRSPQTLRYRSRVRLQVKDGRVGFFSPKSHELIEVEDCLVSSEPAWSVVQEVRKVVKESPLVFTPVAHVEVRVVGHQLARANTSATFSPHPRGFSPSERAALSAAVEPLRTQMSVRLGSEKGALQVYSPSPGVDVLAPVGGFTQVNEAINQLLVARVVEEAVKHGARSFLDLYCGSGNFAMPLLKKGLTGVGVEASAEAIFAAKTSARMQSLDGQFFAEPCDRYLREASKQQRQFDLVVVDPPRAGAKGSIPHLIRLAPRLILMVSCDPATLARDLGPLVSSGYRLCSVEGFDMFPQTHHLETLAILTRDEFPRLSRPAT